MGLLDDAIRDHLDLRRRRGADPADIERAEREALGPVRRDPFEHGPDVDPFEHGPDDLDSAVIPDHRPRAYDHEEEPYDEGYEEYGAEEEWEEDFEDQPGEPHFAPGDVAEADHGELTDRATVLDHEYLEEPQPPVAEEPPAPPSYPAEGGTGDETMRYDVEEALASEHSRTEPTPEWVEQSDEWVEQSEEWAEPAEHEVGAVEPAPHDEPGAPPPHSHDHEPEHGAKPEEDLLEETPESLQDTPDHDRLWFEQRPPRDFDFDG
jgi:hypothetical protein